MRGTGGLAKLWVGLTMLAIGVAVPAAHAAPRASALAKKKDDAKPGDLPGGKWDMKALDHAFRIVKVKHEDNKIAWLLEKTVDGFVAFDVSFYDEDDVKISQTYMMFDPGIPSVAKGERTRGTIDLPKDEILKKSVRVVVTKRQ